jgi:hypothetical protein
MKTSIRAPALFRRAVAFLGLIAAALVFGLLAGSTGTASAPSVATSMTAAGGDEVCRFEDPDYGLHVHSLAIDTVTVTRSNGLLSFEMTFPDDFELSDDMGFLVSVNSDRDSDTGAETSGLRPGDDHRLSYQHHDGSPFVGLDVWRDGEWQDAPSASPEFTHEERAVTLEIDASELGSPEQFEFWVAAGTNLSSDNPDIDYAPSREHALLPADSGVWVFPSCGFIAADGGGTDPSGRVLALLAAGILGAGAVVGVTGWTVERIRKRSA